MKTVTIVGTRKPSQAVLEGASEAVRIVVRSGCNVNTGDAIGIDKVAVTQTRATSRRTRLNIYSARPDDYPYLNNYMKYLFNMENAHIAYAIAEFIHPAWDKCDDYSRGLHARNSYQVMGDALLNPTDLTMSFAPFGNKVTGGTRTAYMLTKYLGLPAINLYAQGHVIDEDLWNKTFLTHNNLNWEFIDSLKRPISPAFAHVLKQAIGEDAGLLEQFKAVYQFD